MIELALLLGLSAVGYALAVQNSPTGEDAKHREDLLDLKPVSYFETFLNTL